MVIGMHTHLLSFERDFGPHLREVGARTDVSEEEFCDGIKKSLPGGAEYLRWVKGIGTADRLADMAKEYRA